MDLIGLLELLCAEFPLRGLKLLFIQSYVHIIIIILQIEHIINFDLLAKNIRRSLLNVFEFFLLVVGVAEFISFLQLFSCY